MKTELRVLAISGSLRRDSENAALIRAAADLAPTGTVVEPWGGLSAIPPFDEDTEDDTPASVADLRAAVAAADAVLISTPEYNGSIPGQLKNALDWASRPYGDCVLSGLPIAVVSASPSGFGAAWAAEHLAFVLTNSGGEVLEQRFALSSCHEAFDGDGRLVDPEHEKSVADLLVALRDQVVASRAAATAA